MNVPILQLIAGASGAVNLLQKIFGGSTPDGGFDSMLENILAKAENAGKPGGLFKGFLSRKGSVDDNMPGAILASSASPHFFQIIFTLKGMGVDSTGIKAILAGDIKGISDNALKSIIGALGFSEKNIAAIMGSSDLKYEIKAQISGQLKDVFKTQCEANGTDVDELIKELGLLSDEVMDKMVSVFKEPCNTLTDTKDVLRDMIAKILVKSGNNVMLDAHQGVYQAQAHSKVTRIIDTFKHTLDIKQDVIKEIFSGTNPELRAKAVEAVTKKIAAYLKANQGGAIPNEVREALAFISSMTSESEWAGIQDVIKGLNPGISLAQAQPNIDKNIFMSLAERLSNDPGLTLDKTLRHIMSQLRASLPKYVRNGQGKVTLRLYPPMLGRVDVNINMQDNSLHAAFRTDQSVTRDILQQNLPMLREALAQQGIKVNHFTVTLGLDSGDTNPGRGFASSYNHGSGHGFNYQRQKTFPDHIPYVFEGYRGYIHADGLDVFA
ncbi:MAG: flagellar hook-length control protein FliK [Thermodesulfobacteriota bacterium]|nr:flagellar hook-length control protein FliK [Thermodesulfobacteriota bacterium]